MKARMTLLSVLLLGALWVAAQSTSSSTSSQETSGTSSSPASPQTTPNTATPGTIPDQSTGSASQSGTTPGQQGGTTPGQSDTGMATGQTGTAGNQNSLRGCLGGSPSNGTYYLTDSKSGATYTLVGGSDQLRTHVGQHVEVTGQALGSGGTSPTSTSSSSSSMGDSSASASSRTSGSTSAQTGDAGSMSTGPGTGNAQTTATNSFQVSNVTKIA